MKFGAEYAEALRKEEYPVQWLESTISYKKLKKCIKLVRQELLSLGLDHKALEALWQHVGTTSFSESSGDNGERMMRYQFTTEEGARFVPKLTVAIDPRDGSPMDAWLSPETKRILQKVGTHATRRPSRRPSEHSSTNHKPSVATASTSIEFESDISSAQRRDPRSSDTSVSTLGEAERITSDISEQADGADDTEVETIEIPLTSDGEFFQILKKELQALERLQDKEQKDIYTDIESLHKDLQVLKSSKLKYARAELDTWREIFRLYLESEIFLSNHEFDAGVRPADKAAQLYQQFTKQLSSIHTNPRKPKSKEAHVALDRFLDINTTILRLLKFQELNRRALGKILKKFDKQTSLHAISTNTPEQIVKSLTLHPNRPGLDPHDLARSTAYTISESLLNLIPQLDDYLCPICAMISYKPIRLRCNHVFCIRCMIKLQRADKDECPMCRQPAVLEATEEHLDVELKRFLKREFAKEVEEKQRENELQAGKEIFGESYTGTHRCVLM